MLAAPLAALLLAAAPIPPAELETFGRRIAADCAAGRDGLAGRVDLDGLLDRALAGVEGSPEFLRAFRTGAKKAGLPMGRILAKEAKDGGLVSFRSARRAGDDDVVRLRLLSAGGAFNVFDLVVARRAAGPPRVVDEYDLAEGVWLSANVRRLALMALAESKLGILDRLSGREQVLLKNAGAVRDLGVARREGRHADALAIYDRLPKALQEDPFVMRQAVFAAMEVDKERYRREMERYIRTFPDDPAAGVMALDVHFMAKEWEAASAAIDAIERFVGTDDGWMAILRGSVASSSGDADGAKRFFAEGFRREPALRAFLAKKKGR